MSDTFDAKNTMTSEQRAVFYQKLFTQEKQKNEDLIKLLGKFTAWFLEIVSKAATEQNDQIKKEYDALSKALRFKAN